MAELEKWINELQCEIDALKRREQSTPPSPSGGYELQFSTLIDNERISGESATTLGVDDPLPNMTGFDFIVVTLNSALDGVVGIVYCPSSLFEAGKNFYVSTPQIYMQDPTNYSNISSYSVHWERRHYDIGDRDELTLTPTLSSMQNDRWVSVYGVKLATANNLLSTSLLTKAKTAVKNAVSKTRKRVKK